MERLLEWYQKRHVTLVLPELLWEGGSEKVMTPLLPFHRFIFSLPDDELGGMARGYKSVIALIGMAGSDFDYFHLTLVIDALHYQLALREVGGLTHDELVLLSISWSSRCSYLEELDSCYRFQ